MLTFAQITTAAVTVTQANLACGFPITYTANYSKAGAPIAQPSFLPFNSGTQVFDVVTSNKADIGVYSIVVTASIP
jgi:hypothetical protein